MLGMHLWVRELRRSHVAPQLSILDPLGNLINMERSKWLIKRGFLPFDQTLLVAFPVTLFDGFAFIEELFTLGDRYLDFSQAIFPIHF